MIDLNTIVATLTGGCLALFGAWLTSHLSRQRAIRDLRLNKLEEAYVALLDVGNWIGASQQQYLNGEGAMPEQNPVNKACLLIWAYSNDISDECDKLETASQKYDKCHYNCLLMHMEKENFDTIKRENISKIIEARRA